MSIETWRLRAITPKDLPFLERLYGSTRALELAQIPWSDAEKAKFVAFQFHAQHTYYQQQFPSARFDLIEVEGQPAGRLYVDRRENEIRLIDIALMPEYRNQGLGSKLLAQLLDESQSTGKPLRIHVEHNNPAMRLYLRLGFVKIEESGIYHLMEHAVP